MDSNHNLPQAANSGLPKERFVSLYGFFAFQYPSHWKNETDEAGNYVFYDDKGGSGVVRVMILQNDFKEGDFLDHLLKEQKDFDASESVLGLNRWVSYVQIHEVEETEFTVYYYAAAKRDKVLLITYTAQSSMKHLPVVTSERNLLNELLGSLEFIQEDEHHHHH